jgi:hypothetical protein
MDLQPVHNYSLVPINNWNDLDNLWHANANQHLVHFATIVVNVHVSIVIDDVHHDVIKDAHVI